MLAIVSYCFNYFDYCYFYYAAADDDDVDGAS